MRIEIYTNEPFKTAKKKAFEAFPNSDSIIFDKKEAPSKWISVEKLLPKACFLVWVCDEANNVYPAFRLGTNYFDRHGNLIESLERVVSWQPIAVPQPPKEE